MKQLLVLSKENLELSSSEVIELLNLKKVKLINNFLIFSKNFEEEEFNLAYTRKILELLFECKKEELEEKLSKFDFSKYYINNFSLRVPQNNKRDKELGGIIYKNLENPNVKLKNSESQFEIYFYKEKAFVCLLKKELNNKFEERKSHRRPSPHPSSLHPKLARCMINMLGRNAKIIVDPFCGSGGLLIEGGLINKKMIGVDLDPIMIKRSYENLKHFKINFFELEQRDSTDIQRMDYFVTDLPYGLNTKTIELDLLYENFFKNLQFKKAVVGFPDFVNYKKILRKQNIKIKKEFNYYLHKNLNKKIVILSLF